jgi:hypothetical protein
MSNIYCIIDACSYVNLNRFSYQIEGSDITLFDILRKIKVVTIKHSRTIADEIKRHFILSTNEALKIDNRVHAFVKYTLDAYDQKLFSGSINASQYNRGEKENLAVTIDLFLDRKHALVYLSDDMKAIDVNGHLIEIINSFPIFGVWTSFDVVLFIYFKFHENKFGSDKAEMAIRDLTSYFCSAKRKDLLEKRQAGQISKEEYDAQIEEVNKKAQKYITNYFKRISIIKNLIAA